MGHNGSEGQPESVAPQFSSWRRTEVELSPPKVAENWKLTRFLQFKYVHSGKLSNVRTYMARLAGV
jgi:hypothetical protein